MSQPTQQVKDDTIADAAINYVKTNSATVIDRFAGTMQSIKSAVKGAAVKGAAVKPDPGSTLVLAVLGLGMDNSDAAVAFLTDPIGNEPTAAARGPVGHSAVRILNYMEHETATRTVLSRPIDAVLIGTEFTFADKVKGEKSVVHLDLTDKAKRDSKQKAVHQLASDTITKWVSKAITDVKKIPGKPTVKVEQATGSGVKAEYAQRVTYTFPKVGDSAEWTWYWVADVDMACYETQTKPTPMAQMRDAVAIGEIIDKHIFGNAKSLGLTPDVKATGGGGHISLDMASSVGYTGADGTMTISFEVLLRTLVDLQKRREWLQQQFNMGGGESDVENAPWLADQTFKSPPKEVGSVLQAYVDLTEKMLKDITDGNGGSIAAATKELKDFNEKLTNPKVTNQIRKAQVEAPGDISHYQAVNIEHLDHPEPDKRRIELRDIPAQTGYVKLIKDLATIGEALEGARIRVMKEQDQRLGHFDF